MSTSVFDQLLRVDNDAYDALAAVAAECIGQRQREGWTATHDDAHSRGEMAAAASCYAANACLAACEPENQYALGNPPAGWMWDAEWWKPKTPWRDLTRAAALCVAEMGRRIRADANGIAKDMQS